MPRRDPVPVEKRYAVDEAGCWLWLGARDDNGYGRVYHPVLKRAVLAHRYFYELHVGEPPDTLDHLCRTPGCVNPDHLEPVTRQENVRRGLRAKLTWDAVRHIRSSSMSNKRIAAVYGVSPSNVCNIRAGRAWPEAQDPFRGAVG